ncbi:hypothetical protein CSUI_011274, partial [Cystoisospora suis]
SEDSFLDDRESVEEEEVDPATELETRAVYTLRLERERETLLFTQSPSTSLDRGSFLEGSLTYRRAFERYVEYLALCLLSPNLSYPFPSTLSPSSRLSSSSSSSSSLPSTGEASPLPTARAVEDDRLLLPPASFYLPAVRKIENLTFGMRA